MADDYTYQLQYLRSRLRTLLNEATASFWSDAQLNNIINESESRIAEMSSCIHNIDSVSTSAGTRTVSFSGFKVEAVEYLPASGNGVSLKKIDQSQVGRVKCLGQTPQYYYEIGNATIGIEPKPDKTYSLNLYVCDYPPGMYTDASVPAIPITFRRLIIPLAYSIARTKEPHRLAVDYSYAIFVNELQYLYRKYSLQQMSADSELKR